MRRRLPLPLALLASTLLVAAALAGSAAGEAPPVAAHDAHDAQPVDPPDRAPRPGTLPRLVSLNPSLTAIVARLGAARAIVGVDDYSARVVPELGDRPRVGGLFDPSLEAVL